MSFGERAALEGLLSSSRPDLAIEIGTAEGGSLQRLAHHSGEVHSFDLVEPEERFRSLPNVHLHTGDSHALLPELLARLTEEGRNVGFVLVDGDHSADGVRQDMEDLLDSPAVGRSVILMHDTMNEEVRRGLEAVPWERWDKVTWVELDFVAGFVFKEPLLHEMWGGLGLVVVDDEHPAAGDPRQPRFFSTHDMLVGARDRMTAPPAPEPPAAPAAPPADPAELAALRTRVGELENEVARNRVVMQQMTASASWRLTAPLRLAKATAKARRGA